MNKNSFLALIVTIFSITVSKAYNNKATDTIPSPIKSTHFEKGKQYILGGISVSGLQKFGEGTVKAYTGLVEGQPIKLPGDKLTSAIKKLYESKQFSKVDVYLTKLDGNTAYLLFDVIELPKINTVKVTGIRKSKAEELIKDAELGKGKMLTDNLMVTSKNYFKKKYTDKGFLKTKVSLQTKKDTSDINSVDMNIHIDRGGRIKVKNINFTGNNKMSDRALRVAMKNTKRKLFGRFWKKSKYVEKEYLKDLESILEKYSRNGYRDARILSEGITWNKDNTIDVNIEVEEGKQYRFGNILFVGNRHFTNRQLNSLLRIDKGDVYNGAVLKERITGNNKPDSEDLQTLYHNNGYLFSSVNAVETGVKNDSIDIEIRIREDEQATIKKVTISGNEKTNDHVIFRELRVKPGDLFSKANIIRSIREIGQLGFFDTNVSPDVKPNYQDKTVDIEFSVVEKGGSQIELQGGYGGGSFIGTLGLSFNNFSVRNIFNGKSYKPLPMGDGQGLSLRAQAARSYNTYSFSFSEPWLGGKKPQSFSFSVYLSNQYNYNYYTRDVNRSENLQIIGASVGLGKRLQWPDDFFTLSQSVSYQRIGVNKYPYWIGSGGSQLRLTQGGLNNLAYNISFSRNSAGPSLIFPTYGSQFTVKAKATFPYSLVNKKKYENPVNPTNKEMQDYLADKYSWLEYYKLGFSGKWYNQLADKLVLMSNFEVGYLGTYNKKLGLTPVERYFVGGDGLQGGNLDGREIIGVRGYESSRLSSASGGSMYNKFQLELRYSITDKPTASIYTLGFVEAGNSYDNFRSYNPFDLKRSAGLGVRIFMPAFGLLGIDFAHGFDSLPGDTSLNPTKSGWQTHFIIGRQF